jgi:hypothetical protein
MTNEQALVALLENHYDQDGLLAIATNNAQSFSEIISRWFGVGIESQGYLFGCMVQRVAVSAKRFSPLPHDPDKWIADCVDRECCILKNRTVPLLS